MKKLLPMMCLPVLLSACSSPLPLPASCEQFVDEYTDLPDATKKQMPTNLFGGELLEKYPNASGWTLERKYRELMNQSYQQIKQQAGQTAADLALKSFESSCVSGLTKVRSAAAGNL